MSQDTYSLPYQLPSLGWLYNGKVPEGRVTILPIRGAQEELLAAAREDPDNALVILQHVIEQLTLFPDDFPFQELLVTDWLALVVNNFAFSLSPVVSLNLTCPYCQKADTQETEISKLEYRTAEAFDKEKYKEPFEFKCPRSGDTIAYKMLRVRDMNRIDEYARKMRGKKGFANPEQTYGKAIRFIGINGKYDVGELECISWVQKALSYDLRFLQADMDKWDTGYNLTPTFQCSRCHREYQTMLSINFFFQFAPGIGKFA